MEEPKSTFPVDFFPIFHLYLLISDIWMKSLISNTHFSVPFFRPRFILVHQLVQRKRHIFSPFLQKNSTHKTADSAPR